MSSFNDILRDIKTLEMIAVLFFSFIGLLILGIDEIWMYVIAIFMFFLEQDIILKVY